MHTKLPTFSRRVALGSLMAGAGALALRNPLFGTLGCDPVGSPAPNRQEVLRQTVNIVMLPTLTEITTQTGSLATQAKAFAGAPSQAALPELRRTWGQARLAWKRAEAFAYGPVEDLSITGGAIDPWPANGIKIDELIDGAEPITDASVGTLGANLRGFPGIEHILFDSAVPPEQVDARLLSDAKAERRRLLLAAQATELDKKCRALADAWQSPTGYGRELAEAGQGSKTFPQQKDAIDKIVTGMLASAELTLVTKLIKPLGLDKNGVVAPALEESPRSDTSLANIEQNLLGLEAIYTCTYGGKSGISMAQDVVAFSAAADKSFRSALATTLEKVRAVKQPMRVLLVGDKSSLIALRESMQFVKRSIATDVASALGASIGFGYSDTD